MYTDLTWWVYLITAIISTSGTALFLWWVIINRFRASFAFTYTLIWIASTAWASWINLHGRELNLTNVDEFYQYCHSGWWVFRTLPMLVAVSLIVGHMAYRAEQYLGRNRSKG